MPRHSVLWSLLLWLCATAAAQEAEPLVGKVPPGDPGFPGNVLVILADDLGVDQLSVYGLGTQLPNTPHIDALAAQGVVFENAWANPICSPTRAAIQTGRYGFRTNIGSIIEESPSKLALAEITIPEMLELGAPGVWAHALIGKWHLDNATTGHGKPNAQGYSHFSGTMGNIDEGSYVNWPKVVNGVPSISPAYATSDQVDDTLSWVEGAPEPWFALLAFSAPHKPFHAPPADLHTVDLTGLDPTTDPKPFYNAMVEAMDTEMGRLFAKMEPELLERTTVLFLGDNGSHPDVVLPPFDPDKAKASPYIGGVRVPFIAKGFRVRDAGRETTAMIHAVDILATVANIAGINPAVTMQGVTLDSRSLLPLLENVPAPPSRSYLYSEFFWPNDFSVATVLDQALRDERYKLVIGPAPTGEFFDMWLDPFETVNLLSQPLTANETTALFKLRDELFELAPAP